MRNLVGVAALTLVSITPAAAETGSLRIKFVYGGDSPPAKSPIDVNKDVEFCGKHDLVDESLVVNPKNLGIKNIVVWVDAGRGSDLPTVAARNETFTLANKDCRFEPHVVVMQAGDTLKVTNPDPVGHNAQMNFTSNPPQNPMIPPGADVEVQLENAEFVPMPVKCSIHPWMSAYVFVQEHPYLAISNEDGVLELSGLPVGEELRFKAWQEKSGYLSEVEVNGKAEKRRAGRFEHTVVAGVNDLGTVTVPVSLFEN